MTARAQHRVDTHARILEAAMALVIEAGFDGLSMRALARRVELTPGALYRYFDGQDALISALTAQVIRDLGDAVGEAALAVPEERPILRILAAAEAYRVASLERPNRFGLVAMLLASPRMMVPDPDRARPLVEQMMVALAPLLGAYARAEAMGWLHQGSAADRAVMTFASIQGLLTLRKQAAHAPDLIDTERLLLVSIRSLLLGWGAPLDVVESALSELGAQS
ncbi:MAG: TetR/AcrR family transcriptional regulator [Proteobacteria bacterium]|nr:TetR/AcrR family transcriptional regulator [Pseudomonadota bacterium]